MFILVSLTAISAVDTNQTDDIVAEDSDTVTQNILSDENDVNSDFNTLHDEINNTQGNTFKLEKNYNYNSENDSDYKDGIKIEKTDFVIDGQGHTIDASNKARILNIVNSTVTLKNINFINGYSDLGGAIYCSNSNLTIIACNFSNNVVYEEDSDGGALLFDGDALIVEDSKFISNYAYNGGAIFIQSSTSKITNTEFSENKAVYYAVLEVYEGNILIDGCTFDSNYANVSAVAYFEYPGNVTVNNTVFKRNSEKNDEGPYYSGALYYNAGGNDTLMSVTQNFHNF